MYLYELLYTISMNRLSMKQIQISDRQSSFIFYLVHQGKGRTEAARLAGFAAPRQSAFLMFTHLLVVSIFI